MRTHTFEIGEGHITIKRPNYREMRVNAEVIEGLFMLESASEVLYSDEFERVLGIMCASEEDLAAAMELDHNEMWELWNKYIEFARFNDFFEGATGMQRERATTVAQANLAAAQQRIGMMKKFGLVPKDFSLSTEQTKQILGAALRPTSGDGETEPDSLDEPETPTKPSSSTSTPANMAGRRIKSS